MSHTECLVALPGGEVVVCLDGEIDLCDRPRLTALFGKAINRSPRVVVDLTDLTFIDSSGLGLLVWALNRAQTNGGNVVITGASPRIWRLMEMTRLDKVLVLHPDRASAVAAHRKRLVREPSSP